MTFYPRNHLEWQQLITDLRDGSDTAIKTAIAILESSCPFDSAQIDLTAGEYHSEECPECGLKLTEGKPCSECTTASVSLSLTLGKYLQQHSSGGSPTAPERILKKPLTHAEAIAIADEDNFIDVIVRVTLADIIDANYETFLDLIWKAATGTQAMNEIDYELVGLALGQALLVRVAGDISDCYVTDSNKI